MEREKIVDILGVSYAFCDGIDDFMSQCSSDEEAIKEIKKDKDLINFASEIKHYFDNDFKKMDEYYESIKENDWSGYETDAVSSYLKSFFV